MTVTGDEPDRTSAPDPDPHSTTPRRRTASAVTEVCPFLRDSSGAWRSAYASRDHRCGAVEPPAPLAVAKQRSLCLVPAHRTCATYLATQAAAGDGRVDAGAALWPPTRSAPLLLEPVRGHIPMPGSARTGGQAVLAGLMVLAFLVLVVARTTAPPSSGSPQPDTSAGGAATSPSPSAVASPSPAPAVTGTPPAPSPSTPASPTTTGTPSATAPTTPTTSPTAAARRYTVRSGDTLSSIAARFGTTVKAIRAANDLSGNVIRPGQLLVIP